MEDKVNTILSPGLHLMDCMEGMAGFPDKYFDLAIVDPPYGGAVSSQKKTNDILRGGCSDQWSAQSRGRFGGWFDRYHIGPHQGGQNRRYMGGEIPPEIGKHADIQHWDVAPGPAYFQELARVSRNQIIWGGNYFDLPPTRCFVVWDKKQPENFSMAMCEYAWTSFNDNAKVVYLQPQGRPGERFHPTQKPVALYAWILEKYAKPGMRILDTHAGSGSLEVACMARGLDCWGFEIDPYYHQKATERIRQESMQVTLLDVQKEIEIEQQTLFD